MPKQELIKAHTVITAHSNADFDCLSAMVAASKIYPGSVLIFPGSQEKNLRNFYIQSTTYLFNFKPFKDIDPDAVKLLVVVDTRQKSRLVHVQPLLDNPNVEIHAYDHHPDTDEDVDAVKSVVEPWGSATSILIRIMRERGIEVGPEEATMLGLGIYEDTGSFSFASTTSHDFDAASWLCSHGMDLTVIAELLNRDLSAEQVAILGDLVDSATTHDINGVQVVITEVTTSHFVSDFALLAHKLIDLENIRILFAIGRMGDRIHLVARSKTPDVDVGRICSSFGGGGHSYAASATIKDKTLSEVRDELFTLLYSSINPQIVVETLMSRPAVAIKENKSMRDAAELMTRFGLKGVPVVARGKRICVGILEHKIADKALSHGLDDLPVSEYMLRDFSSITPVTDIYDVMEIILGRRQRLVPVIEKGLLSGVITRTDLINKLVEEPARIPESLLPERKREANILTFMKQRLSDETMTLLSHAGELAQDMGQEVYAVGGFVRDIILNRPNNDIDLVVEGDGIEFARRLAVELGGRVKPHHKFKTAVVILPDDMRIDVATARLEYYEYPAALPTVELSSIKMDLYRRDFTINAIATQLNPGSFGQVVDFFGAQEDIKRRKVRVLHSLSFVEDPTRILRAIRFEQRFGFQVGEQTLRLVKNAIQLNLFNMLSGSRIFHELKLIMEEEEPLASLVRMQELNILPAIHPLLKLTPERLKMLTELEKVHNWYRLLYNDEQPEPWRLYFLGLGVRISREKMFNVMSRLNLTKREEREFASMRDLIGAAFGKLMHWKDKESALSQLCRILDPLPVEGVLFLMAKSRKEAMRRKLSQYLARFRYETVDVTGEDLKDMNIPEGPIYSTILGKVRDAKIDGKADTREQQLELARKVFKSHASSFGIKA